MRPWRGSRIENMGGKVAKGANICLAFSDTNSLELFFLLILHFSEVKWAVVLKKTHTPKGLELCLLFVF